MFKQIVISLAMLLGVGVAHADSYTVTGDNITITKTAAMPMRMGPSIDDSKIPPRTVGYNTQRVMVSPPGQSAYYPVQSDIGAFRIDCKFASMSYDDPLVFPGQPGKSHLHTFFGNTIMDAFTTSATVAGQPSTCQGGTLNSTGYWTPTLVDSTVPVVPTANEVYYKTSYDFDDAVTVVSVPIGLHLIAQGGRFSCTGPGTNTQWYNDLVQASKDPICNVAGNEIIMNVNFPFCWDGKNLDSPDQSHIVGSAQLQKAPWTKFCPADHPVAIPNISYNIHYNIPDAGFVGRITLSSDMDTTKPRGYSGHGDYMMGWDKTTMDTLVTNCLHKKMDCHTNVLGNGTTLY